MDKLTRLLVENWTADYGDGHVETVCVPHSWRQDVPVAFEGPVVYRTEIEVPRKPTVLRFHGVSYQAEVSFDGKHVATHRGIWDAFDVPLDGCQGKRVAVEVRVIKNGGPTFPVRDVASGFLPYVFHTFGGIHGEVELIGREVVEPHSTQHGRDGHATDGHKIYVDGQPFYPRGLLHWGWYPELGHTHPPAAAIRAEVRAAKRLGFNLIKFCLWVPPHRYLEILREEGMLGWMELPLWDPSDDPAKLEAIADEMERIVRQYRHHDNILCWTIGCELSKATPPEYRRRLVQLVKNLTGSPLVKDNSGGAEVYGGDLREFGDFDDFHPYCDLPFYPPVLDSLLPGPRPSRPVLLGEYNDFDVHRDLSRLADELPFWASRMSELNDQGVRWKRDLPDLIQESAFAKEPRKSHHKRLMESSRSMALFVRKYVNEAVRARQAISGYVVTGMRDTPIASSGFFDDWGGSRFSPEECLPWNGPDVLFQIPSRRPPWVNGGNRPGWIDLFNFTSPLPCGSSGERGQGVRDLPAQILFRIGLHSEGGAKSGLIWSIIDSNGIVVARDAIPETEVPALESREVGQISWECAEPGSYRLRAEFGGAANEWPVNVFEEWDGPSATDARLLFLESGDKRVLPMPFWREAAYEFHGDAWNLTDRWERLLAISPDLALDPLALPEHEVVINRIDTRTYAEHPIAVKTKDHRIITTLRPFGGLGIQPSGIKHNPSGAELVRAVVDSLA